ncbi:peptidase S8 and S53 subtilisin kexin sedolisin [Natrialba asiatica DSM 12278]|uniref:Peptidase S8 and S53 subtilisin kexin sedolisin n=1 Tax=Natrialba asiatica (strain ATCC 700177 / DSM 12278 / JCM 9576 / FERM P-10747 / NBRC 102637 / 172P1) TaxID=29540 RepID=M0AID6_NATA1|nr:peptidase S8 and S53 subtilisin kexin sedolisin [Natrialba asiatica DSM 12278]
MTYSDDGWDSLSKEIENRDGVTQLSHLEDSKTVFLASSDSDIGVGTLDRILGNGLQSLDEVERVDLVVDFARPEPVTSMLDEGEFEQPGWWEAGRRTLDTTGIAFEASETTTLRDARETLGVHNANFPALPDLETVRVGVVDTGINVDNGQVFGRGARRSPIRIPAAKDFSKDETDEAVVSYGRVRITHTSGEDFDAGTWTNLSSGATGDDAYLMLDLAKSRAVSTQAEFQDGTLTDTVATSSDDLELDTDGSGNYLSSGTYDSQWFDFGVTTTFQSATINETLNAETTTWEYRSSPDGTAENASAWQSSLTDVPNDQFLQVRVTLNSSDGSATPQVHDYTIDAEALQAEYTGDVHVMEDIDRAFVDVTLDLADATVTLEGRGDDTESWTTVHSETVSSTDEHLFGVSSGSDYAEWRWRISIDTGTDGSSATGEIHAEGLESPEQIMNEDSDWSPVADGDGHGSWCAAMIGAHPDNALYRGIAADAPVDFYVAKALADDGSGSTQSIAEAIDWMDNQGVDVINLSLGSQFYNEVIDDAIQSFLDNGGSAVAVAAGNDRQVSRWINSPSDSANVVTVAATTNEAPEDASVGYFSNVGPSDGVSNLSDGKTRGETVDIAAPGIDIEAMYPSSTGIPKTRTLTGTSMATPAVTGAIALLLASEPSLKGDHEEIKTRLKETAEPIPAAGETEVGAGMPRVDRLLADDRDGPTQSEAVELPAATRDRANETMTGSSFL